MIITRHGLTNTRVDYSYALRLKHMVMVRTMVDIRSMLHHIRYLLHNRRSNTYSNTVCRRQARQRRRESRSVRTLQLRFPGSVAGFRRCAQSPGL